MTLAEAENAIRELSAGPQPQRAEVCNKGYDALLEAFPRLRLAGFSSLEICGLPVVIDPAVPENTIRFRMTDGAFRDERLA